MIALFTDFGLEGPYMGQMRAVLHREAPGVPVIDLMADVPAFDMRGASYLLAALVREFLPGDVLLCIVDPGVGGPREAVALRADGLWFVGPDNGIFEMCMRRAAAVDCYRIAWRPRRLSSSFHGRDLFAPVAGRLGRGEEPARAGLLPASVTRRPDWPDDLAAVIYADRYGNLMTGLRASRLRKDARLGIGGREVAHARTFCDVAVGGVFWYENSSGLVEIAANQANASKVLQAGIGAPVDLDPTVWLPSVSATD